MVGAVNGSPLYHESRRACAFLFMSAQAHSASQVQPKQSFGSVPVEDLNQFFQTVDILFYFLIRQLIVLQVAGQITVVGSHVNQSMSG